MKEALALSCWIVPTLVLAQTPPPGPVPTPNVPPALVSERVTCQWEGPSATAQHICAGRLDGRWLLRCAGTNHCTAMVYGPLGAKVKWTSTASPEYRDTIITGQNKTILFPSLPKSAQLVRGPWIGNVGTEHATVRWETNGVAQATLLHAAAGFVWTTGTSLPLPGGRYRHSVSLSALSPGQSQTVQLMDLSTPKLANFRTAPSGVIPFRFVSFGDYQCGNPGLLQGLLPQVGQSSHFFVSTGDMIESYGSCNWDSFFNAATFLSQGAFYPAQGNNDPFPDWMDLFPFPQPISSSKRYYSFSYSNTKFLVLYSGEQDSLQAGHKQFPPKSATVNCTNPASQTDFVSCELTAATKSATIRNVIVVLHMPPLTYPGPTAHTSNQDELDNLVPLLEDTPKVRAVLAGHNHFYQRIFKNNPIAHRGRIHYFVSGGGGATLYSPTANPSSIPEIKKQEAAFHFAIWDVTETGLSVTIKRYNPQTKAFSTIETVQM